MIISFSEFNLIKQHYINAYKAEGWKEIDDSIKDGRMFLLLVTDSLTPLQDSLFSVTIGLNNYLESGDDKWHISGWDWSHDIFTEDTIGRPLLYKDFEHNIITTLQPIV